MKYFIGIDGGGTKTELVVVNENGSVVAKKRVGSSNASDLGKERVIELLLELVQSALPADTEQADVCMGLSGVGFSGCAGEIEVAIAAIPCVGKVRVYSDVQIALDSAYDEDGCIVIIGTGSVGYVRLDGELHLVGGSGFMLDSSLSGYDLGREAINAVLSATDGRGEQTLLTGIFEGLGERDIRQTVRSVYAKGKAYVASFAPTVFEAFDKGDKVAESILRHCVSEWEKLLLGVWRTYGKEKCEVTLFGGVTKRWETVKRFLSGEMLEKINFRVAEKPVVWGAAKGAASSVSEAFYAEFIRTY